jgi:hypothetical protein
MQFSESQLEHALDPLKVVDIKTLNGVADNFKKSKDKSKRAIGVFLDRINRLRMVEPGVQKGETQTTTSSILRSSGLKDLRE